ncbi:hypothetical protein AURDEDRAFT_157064 [Auricularia subglabra TFB-10046 SS5]|nr:hypothetical protein AURDEDRAFT_157064 [Auricularia subglabra TFB-10046 SS5]
MPGRGRGAVVISTPHAADPPPPRAPDPTPPPRALEPTPPPPQRIEQRDASLSPRYSPSLPSSSSLPTLDSAPSPPTSWPAPAPTAPYSHPRRRAILDVSTNPPRTPSGPRQAASHSPMPSRAPPAPSPPAPSPPAPSPPAVKLERTTTPPLSDVPPVYKESGVLYLPLPDDCKRVVPTFRANRDAWKAREVAALKDLGLAAKPEFIRDDGMTMQWTSSTPVMLVAHGIKTASEIRVLHPPAPLQEDDSSLPSAELMREIPAFLRGLPADSPNVSEWIRLEVDQLREVDGLHILSTELVPEDSCLRLRALDTSEAIMEARQHQRDLQRHTKPTKLRASSSDVHRIPIPAFIQPSVAARDFRGQLWIRLQVDNKEGLERRKVVKEEVVGDVLLLSFAPETTAPPRLTAATSNERKRKHNLVSQPVEDGPRKPPSPGASRQAAPADGMDVSNDIDEVQGLLTPATTHAADDELQPDPEDDRKLGLRFLERHAMPHAFYFQAFDSDRKALHDAYAPRALFSYQVHDLPSGTANEEEARMQSTFAQRQGQRNLIFASHRHGKFAKEQMQSVLKGGRHAVIESLDALGPHTYGYNAQFSFDIERVPELGDVFLLVCDGDILHVINREMQHYTQVFVMKKSSGSTSWPFSILSQHLTLRPKPSASNS